MESEIDLKHLKDKWMPRLSCRWLSQGARRTNECRGWAAANLVREPVGKNGAIATLPPYNGSATASLCPPGKNNCGAAALLYPHKIANGTPGAHENNPVYCEYEMKMVLR